MSKRRRFAPAAVYKPFGEEAAGTHSLPQFQALQESNKEIASLRELGLSESEIHLWKNHASAGKVVKRESSTRHWLSAMSFWVLDYPMQNGPFPNVSLIIVPLFKS